MYPCVSDAWSAIARSRALSLGLRFLTAFWGPAGVRAAGNRPTSDAERVGDGHGRFRASAEAGPPLPATACLHLGCSIAGILTDRCRMDTVVEEDKHNAGDQRRHQEVLLLR